MSPTKKPEFAEVSEPSPSYLAKLGKLASEAVGNALGIPLKPSEEKIHKLTAEEQEQLRRIEEEAISKFSGDLTQLEAALGMLRIGHHFGWKVLYILHSKQTIRKYEGYLGIQVRDIFKPEGPSSYRSYGYTLASKFRNFWKVAGGEIKIPHRQSATE
jgi:hypothetical protein